MDRTCKLGGKASKRDRTLRCGWRHAEVWRRQCSVDGEQLEDNRTNIAQSFLKGSSVQAVSNNAPEHAATAIKSYDRFWRSD